jgi:cytosine/adenosine deaminase-related metal-dependent hydrolase
MIKEADARVAHLPVANLYLASGVAPIPAMLSMGITVSLGTDNANCNDAVNMFREMAVAALIHKGTTLDAAAVNAKQILSMATIGGARAMGEEGWIGSIEKGKRADIVLLDAKRTHLTLLHDPISTLVYQADGSEVDTVLADGQILVEGGALTFMTEGEEAELRREAQHRSAAIAARAGFRQT